MELDFSQLSAPERYKFLTAVVVPRPIAWVTSVNAKGDLNAAPFSFFNVFGSNPAVVVLGIGNRPDGSPKDTVANIAETGEFVVNLATEELAQQMVQTSASYPPATDELAAVGLTQARSSRVKPPRIAESPVSLECTLIEIKPIGGNRLVIGEVVHASIHDAYYDPAKGYVHTEQLRPIGRMHGPNGYVNASGYFEITRPS